MDLKIANVTNLDDVIGEAASVVVDTEFSRLPYEGESVSEWSASVELLSIGATRLVPVGAGDFYGVVDHGTAGPWSCSEFTRSHVLPHLLAGCSPGAEPTARLAHRFTRWLGLDEGPVALIVDHAFDVYLVSRLFSPLAQATIVLVSELHGLPDEYWRQPRRRRHHALHDAQATADALRERLARIPITEAGALSTAGLVSGAKQRHNSCLQKGVTL